MDAKETVTKPFLTSERNSRGALACGSAPVPGRVSVVATDEVQVALTKRKKKKKPSLSCQEQSPVKTEVRFQPMNPREIMYHENMAREREKQHKGLLWK